MIVEPKGDSNELFFFDPAEMKVSSKDGSINVVARSVFGSSFEYRVYGYAIEWKNRVFCFRARIDFTRDDNGNVVTIDDSGRQYGIAWSEIKLHGTVRDTLTGKTYRSSATSDPVEYTAFGNLVVNFLSVNRVVRNYPPVRSITFDLSERFLPPEMKVN